jgi:hypothetical protein
MSETGGPQDLPEAAARRIAQEQGGGAWSSGLSTADFASCLALGAEPVAFVQGYAVMLFSSFVLGQAARAQMWGAVPPDAARERFGGVAYGGGGMYGGATYASWGFNVQQPWLEERWTEGWRLARQRMTEEAAGLGAHGVLGVNFTRQPLAGTDAVEFRMQGTAVRVPGVPTPSAPFTTTLSGQRLTKLLESGFAPVSVVGTAAVVLMAASNLTSWQLVGNAGMGMSSSSGPIEQVDRAQHMVRHLARERVRGELGPDTLHGAVMTTSESERGEGLYFFECTLTGNRIRQFAPFEKLAPPRPIVTLR